MNSYYLLFLEDKYTIGPFSLKTIIRMQNEYRELGTATIILMEIIDADGRKLI